MTQASGSNKTHPLTSSSSDRTPPRIHVLLALLNTRGEFASILADSVLMERLNTSRRRDGKSCVGGSEAYGSLEWWSSGRIVWRTLGNNSGRANCLVEERERAVIWIDGWALGKSYSRWRSTQSPTAWKTRDDKVGLCGSMVQYILCKQWKCVN